MRKLLITAPVLLLATSLSGCAALQQAAGSVALPAVDDATALRQDMRQLWADHVVWTRQYIVAAVGDDPSASVALARLMRNQEDIGNAIKPYYGADAGNKLTSLLKDHISIAGELVAAAKAGNTTAQANADKRWHDNAADIATFLSAANPHWPRATMLAMLNEHLSLTTQEAVARLQRNWPEDQRLFDKIFAQSMEMADMLSMGILHQFPARRP